MAVGGFMLVCTTANIWCTICIMAMGSDDVTTVVAAAVRTSDGRVFSVRRPGRHHDVVHMMVERFGIPQTGDQEQGFLLSDGTFCRRAAARTVAEQAGQLLPRAMDLKELYSEDVW